MERLTVRDDDGVVALRCREDCRGGPACFSCEQNAIDRLAAYEDTGLEPKELLQILRPRQPLTEEDLRKMDGLPVCFERYGQTGYGIVNAACDCIMTPTSDMRFADLGMFWDAYPPILGEETEDA